MDAQHSYSNSGSFNYDLANNLNAGGNGWSYNAANQLTSAPSGLGGLPAAGNLTYTNPGEVHTLGGETFSYDAFHRLSQITGTPSGTVTFTYDFAGRRVSKSVNGQTTYYLYDGADLLAEVNSSGQIATVYTTGPACVISDPVNLQGTPQSRFYLFDASGSTRALLDQNGALLASGAYTAWGNPLGYTPNTPLAWNGRGGCYTDAETGLVLMGARYYSPALGRFLSRDTTLFESGVNVYAYCWGDPVDLVDTNGMDPWWREKPYTPDGSWTFPNIVDEAVTLATTSPVQILISGPPKRMAEADCEVIGLYDGGKASTFQAVMACADFSGRIGDVAMAAAGPICDGAEALANAGRAGSRAPDELRVDRFGWPPEAAEKLAAQAAAAKAHPGFGVHGVSTTSAPLRPAPSATAGALRDAGFDVIKTGKANNYTVELPEPVTQDVATLFNQIFGGKTGQ